MNLNFRTKNRNYLTFILIFFLLIFLYILLSQFKNPQLNRIKLNDNPQILISKKQLTPILQSDQYDNLNTQLSYNEPKIRPGSFSYILDLIDEIANVSNDYRNSLFFANRKIIEMSKFRNILKINHEINDVDTLTSWWKKNKPTISYFIQYKKYGSWESLFARYFELMTLELQYIEKHNLSINNIAIYEKYIRKHQEMIYQIIFESEISNADKTYLIKLWEGIQKKLLNRIIKYDTYYDPINLKYDLTEIIKNKEMGIFKVTINFPNLPQYLKDNITLKINDRVYKLSRQGENNNQYYSNLKIDSKSNHLLLRLHDIFFPLKNLSWQTSLNSNGYYIYYINLPYIRDNSKFLIKVNYQFNNLVYLNINENINFNQNKNQWNSILQTVLIPSTNTQKFQSTISLVENGVALQNLVLISKKPISKNQLKAVYIELVPIIDSTINLERVDFLKEQTTHMYYKKLSKTKNKIIILNSSINDDRFIKRSVGLLWMITSTKNLNNGYEITVEYLPSKIKELILIILFLYIFFVLLFFFLNYPNIKLINTKKFIFELKSKLIYKVHIFFKKNISFILNKISILISKLRFLFLLSTFILLFTEIVIISQINNKIVFLTIVLWLLFMIGYRLKININFYCLLIFFLLSESCFIFNKYYLAEKFAIWAFISLTTSTIYIIFNLNNTNQTNLNSLIDFIKLLLEDVKIKHKSK